MSLFDGIAAAVALIALAARLAGRQRRLLHLFQLEHYEPARLILWLRRRSELVEAREAALVAALYVAGGASAASGAHWLAGALLLLSAPIAYLGHSDWRRPAAKPLVFTARAKRLFAVALAPSALVAAASVVLAPLRPSAAVLVVMLALGWLLLVLAPYVLLLANRLLRPVEAGVNRRFVTRARETLSRVSPLTIGITGSYGKTTTKFCVGAVLSADRPTLVTPASFNSYLGVVRAVNEGLKPEHEAFVAEMGMFRRGDIAELCELTHPSIGVITAIGPMHLERLGSIEQIAAAKAELAQALPPDGHLVTNADDHRCLAIAGEARVPVTLFGVEGADATVRATGIAFAKGRTEFDLHLPGAEAVHVSAQLLGRHNVSNLLAAAAVGHVVGIAPDRIVEGLERVQAPEHRLSPIHNRAARILVIDDAYNSNPDGAAAALEVLREHEAGRRLLVTPGMVELGDVEQELNRRFGEQAAAICDHVVLVGPKRTVPIREGLLSAGMSAERVHVVGDIGAATALLGSLTRAGDVILFENDLPDTYAEDGAAG